MPSLLDLPIVAPPQVVWVCPKCAEPLAWSDHLQPREYWCLFCGQAVTIQCGPSLPWTEARELRLRRIQHAVRCLGRGALPEPYRSFAPLEERRESGFALKRLFDYADRWTALRSKLQWIAAVPVGGFIPDLLVRIHLQEPRQPWNGQLTAYLPVRPAGSAESVAFEIAVFEPQRWIIPGRPGDWVRWRRVK